jgi:XTP/dITP diphosphohydrolase
MWEKFRVGEAGSGRFIFPPPPRRAIYAAMVRKLTEPRLVIASHNEGKLREIADLLAPFGVAAVPAAELGLPEPDETGATFSENAELKARASAKGSGLPALADDSGLAVHALDGEPGIHSARWAETPDGRDFLVAMQRVETALQGKSDRSAHFVSVLALAWPDGHIECFEGRVDGALVWPPRGENGFGYDPVFLPDGHDMTFGEMAPAAKNPITHRADAFAKLVAACFEGGPR